MESGRDHAGSIARIHYDAVVGKPGTINKYPYAQGWVVKIKPANWSADAATLKIGAKALAAFEAKMQTDGFRAASHTAAAESGSPPLAREGA
jgi:hypothetical protein